MRIQLSKLFPVLVVAILLAFIGPWFFHDTQVKAINHDIFWLTESAGHLWQGWKLGTQIYEPNPPLSILIYLPVYALISLTHLSVEYAVALCGLAALFASTAAVIAVLKSWEPVIDQWDRWFAGLALLLIGTILATPHFGQRDQILFFGLLPFLLMQLAITQKKPVSPALKYAVIMIGAILILLKPHYGLLPALVVVHRMICARRGLRVLSDADVVLSGLIGCAYAGVIIALFPGYAHTIFPDAMSLYVMDGRKTAWDLVALLALIGVVVLGVTSRLRIETERKAILCWLLIASLSSLAVFAIMHRNYMYQLLPALSFFIMAAGMGLYGLLRRGMGPRAAMIEALVIVAVFCMVMPHSYYPSQLQARDMPLARIVNNVCAGQQNCHFMLWSESLRVTQLTARYSNAGSGSRFPGLWFMGALQNHPDLHRKYGVMMGEDLRFYKPAVIIACNEFGADLDIFSKSEGFRQEFTHYQADGQFLLDIASYETAHASPARPPEPCNIYRRGS